MFYIEMTVSLIVISFTEIQTQMRVATHLAVKYDNVAYFLVIPMEAYPSDNQCIYERHLTDEPTQTP